MVITLTLTAQEVDLILTALGKRPYDEVFRLVPKILQQGRPQMEPPVPDESEDDAE